MQELEVLLVCRGSVLRHQGVIRDTEYARREHLLPIAVLRERPRLPHQPLNHMPIADQALVPAPQTRQPLQPLLGIPHVQMLGVQPHLDHFADQPARHRVGVPLDVQRAAAVHATADLLERLQPQHRQRPQQRALFLQTLHTPRIELTEQVPQEVQVLVPAGEVPAATQHQCLVHSVLEAVMPLLDVAVLMGMARLDLLGQQPIMLHQAFVTLCEVLLLRQVVHRRAQPVGPVPLRHPAQLPQRVLQAFAQALEALREADRRRLPVRVGQHEVVDQVLERLTLDGHTQAAHPREVRRRQPARLVHLGEEHFLGRTVQRSPAAHLPLQGPQLSVREPTRMAALQLLEDRLGLKPRVLLQQFAHFRPDRDEWIDPCPPGVLRRGRARQLPESLVLTCRLLVHVRPRRRCRLRLAAGQQPPQLLHLLVGNHRKPPCLKGLRQFTAYSCAKILIVVGGKSNCRQGEE